MADLPVGETLSKSYSHRFGTSLGSFQLRGLLPAIILVAAVNATAAEIRVAVAANFADCLEALAPAFADSTGHQLVLSRGSTGKIFAQIKAGAPFDVFLAADSRRPAQLESDGLIMPGTRFTYAEGRLVLWVPLARPEENRAPADLLRSPDFQHLAIANPRLAPYGLAAKQVLQNLGLWEGIQPHLVTGQSIGQAWQFVASGNAEAGLLAYAQVVATQPLRGKWWKIDPPLHEPILQQAVALKSTPHPEAAVQLLDFLKGPEAHMIMIRFGYLIPEN